MADETPKERSDLLTASIATDCLLTTYFATHFGKWFGLSNPAGFATGTFSAWTISWLADRPKRLWFSFKWFGFDTRRATAGAYFLLLAVLALAAYVVGRIIPELGDEAPKNMQRESGRPNPAFVTASR
jgi:hypothetical protein